jgi:hypothetical protein
MDGKTRRTILGVLLTTSSCAVAGTRVTENTQLAAALRAMTDNVISQWEILDLRPGGNALIGSPPRPDPTLPGFCIRDVIQLGVDAEGRLLSAGEQVERMNTSGISPTFRMFALSDKGACSMASNSFFRARTLEGAMAPSFALMIARDFAIRMWTKSPTKYRLHYLDDQAKRCMKGGSQLQILGIKESSAREGSIAYQVVLGGCVDSSTDMVVTADVVLPLDRARADVDLLAISKAEYECLQIECLRDAP